MDDILFVNMSSIDDNQPDRVFVNISFEIANSDSISGINDINTEGIMDILLDIREIVGDLQSLVSCSVTFNNGEKKWVRLK